MRTYVPKWIEPNAYKIIVAVMQQYPALKEEYRLAREEIVHSSPCPPDGQPGGGESGNPTERKAVRLTEERMEEMSRKITAVENVLGKLNKFERQVVTERFWKSRDYYLIDAPYGDAQKKRIVKRFLYLLGVALGELDQT